jgi:Tfp pilus assembly protein PilN
MIRINLLGGYEPQRPVETNRLRNGFLVSLGAVLIAFLLGSWALNSRIGRMNEEKNALEKQAAGFAAIQQEIKELKDKKELASKRLAQLQRLEEERHGPVRLMEKIAAALPANQLWITAVKETDTEIRIDGLSLSNQILADFMKRLDGLPGVVRIDLVQSSQVAYKDLKIKQFTVTALKKGAEAPPAPTEKK